VTFVPGMFPRAVRPESAREAAALSDALGPLRNPAMAALSAWIAEARLILEERQRADR
jgi:hypothetical protein